MHSLFGMCQGTCKCGSKFAGQQFDPGNSVSTEYDCNKCIRTSLTRLILSARTMGNYFTFNNLIMDTLKLNIIDGLK